MVVNKPPFTDNRAKNTLVIPKGSYAWLKVKLRVGVTVSAPDADAFTFDDVVEVTDPDAVNLSAAWGTNVLDPDDPSDIYDENHSTYVGDLATPNQAGLFHDGGGSIALKVLVPNSAEETTDNNSRQYTVTWRIKKNGVFVVGSETFNVGDAGVFVFSQELVTVAQVEAGIFTNLSDPEIQDIIIEASEWADGMLEACGIDVDSFTELPKLVKTAIILYARSLILDYDASAGLRAEMKKEGSRTVKYATQTTRDIETFRTRAMEAIEHYCRNHSPKRRVRLDIARQATTSRPYGTGRVADRSARLYEDS